MSLPIEKFVEFYEFVLTPIPYLAAIGLPVGILDIAGTLRLALAVRQIKYSLRLKASQKSGEPKLGRAQYGDSALSSIWAMLVIVYGGELFVSSFTSQSPSFFTNPTGPILLALGHYVVSLGFRFVPNLLPMQPSLNWEIPFSVVDALTRSVLLCTISPSVVLGHESPGINDSPTALLLASTLMANGGFFLVNTFSMLSHEGWSLSTPPELLPYGWASLDLLCAPFITAIYATLTQSQTAFHHLHTASFSTNITMIRTNSQGFVSDSKEGGETPFPGDGAFDEETARAICAMVLSALFVGRTWRNYGYQSYRGLQTLKLTPKAKTQ